MANHGQVVSWVLEVLGCKVCPAEGAVGKALEALEKHVGDCPELADRRRKDPSATCVGCCDEGLCEDWQAVRALRGEGGEE